MRWFFFWSLVLLQDFVISLSIILRGSITDKLNWAFNLYDLNKDGCITREVTTTPASDSSVAEPQLPVTPSSLPGSALQEMTDIMGSIYDMMGKYTYPNMRDSAPREHVDSFFQVKAPERQKPDVKRDVDELGKKK